MLMKAYFVSILFVLTSLLLAGCSSVPKEAVDLSYQIGKDTEVVHQSYRKLVRTHFQQSRQFAEQEWTSTVLPGLIKIAIEEGQLIDVVAGKVIYDPATQSFTKPTPGLEYLQLEQTMQIWSKEIGEIIAKSRSDMLAQIDEDEKKLLDYIDASFTQLARGNAAISAHLSSLRKVQDAQDSVLERADLKELRDEINNKIAGLSDDAKNKADRLSKSIKRIDELKTKMKGGK